MQNYAINTFLNVFYYFQATLKVNNSQRIMILGQSKDLGTCRSTKKNGEKCTAFVNTNLCEYCIYHVKQEYQKCSRRSELQSSFAGHGLIALRNKVLGKNEVFYAGKSYTAIPAAKNKKLLKKDESRLQLLSGSGKPVTKTRATQMKIKKHAAHVEAAQNQRKRDLEILRKLDCLNETKTHSGFTAETLSPSVSLEESKKTALDVISKLKSRQQKPTEEDSSVDSNNRCTVKTVCKVLLKQPESIDCRVDNGVKKRATLKDEKIKETDLNIVKNDNVTNTNVKTQPVVDKTVKDQIKTSNSDNTTKNVITLKILPTPQKFIDLSVPIPTRKIDRAKQKALNYVQKNGPIEKVDPNNIRGNRKRTLLDADDTIEQERKRIKKIQENEFYSEKFKRLMAMTSRNADLLELREEEEKEKYFNRMEMREKMEEKMMTTYKVACKAVRCLQCKYTSFSAADRCKTERHPLKVTDAFKRFFKCANCGNRTVCLDVVPTKSCSNCGSGKWERTTMMKERNVVASHGLSIRGGEQKFVNSVLKDANINLLVPDDE